RVVLDTNCVVSALVFRSGRLRSLREGWQAGLFTPLICHETAAELIRVLAYPKFKLQASEQETLLADYLPYAQTVEIDTDQASRPSLRDPDDSIFVTLAKQAKADKLITGDKDILDVRGQIALVTVMTVAEFADWVTPDHTPPSEA